MRMLLNTCLIGLGAIALPLIIGFAWLFFASRGLPDALALAQFAPATEVSDPCLKPASVAIPVKTESRERSDNKQQTGSKSLKLRPRPVDCLGLTKRWSLYVASHGNSRVWD